MRQNRLMGDGGSELEVRDRDRAVWVLAGNKLLLCRKGEKGAPEVGTPVNKPYASHSALAGVARAGGDSVGIGDQFGQARGAGSQVIS